MTKAMWAWPNPWLPMPCSRETATQQCHSMRTCIGGHGAYLFPSGWSSNRAPAASVASR